MKPKLLIALCEHKAAKYAVETWHYSHTMPVGRLVSLGVWEDGKFVGAVVFGRGASPYLGNFLGLDMTQCCELVRVALNNSHKTTTSRILAISLKVFARLNPGIRAVVSFADPEQNHNGCIYRATNWLFMGLSAPELSWHLRGRWLHRREVISGAFGQASRYTKEELDNAPTRKTLPKIKYVYCLDEALRAKASEIALPYSEIDKHYPMRYRDPCVGGASSSTPAPQAGDGGANPTPTLETP